MGTNFKSVSNFLCLLNKKNNLTNKNVNSE